MTSRIAITGGLGYLGGRVAAHLKKAGYSPRLLTRNTDRNLPDWTNGLEVVGADIGEVASLETAFSNIDQVIHLAAMNAPESAGDPDAAKIVNVGGTRNVVNAAKNVGVTRMIYMSTAHVYGAPLRGHLDELAATTNLHPYAATHRRAEDIVLNESEIEGVVLRLSNGVGQPLDNAADCWMLIANDLCRQAVTNNELVLRGSGLDKRDFIPLGEVTRAVGHFTELEKSQVADGLFNLAASKAVTTLSLAEQVASRAEIVLGTRPEIQCGRGEDKPAPEFDICIDKLTATGFSINRDLNAELDATLLFCRDHFPNA
jgi:UDP-glucose 4-epimerase